MATTHFSTQVRMLACQQCGAPIAVSPAGGAAQCRYCHAQNQFQQQATRSLAHHPQPLAEPERIARLRAQDGKPLLPPASLAPLFEAGDIPAWKMDEAVRVWNLSRKEVTTTGAYEAAERMYFLTFVLAQKYGLAGDLERQRTMLESAAECLTFPRHLQGMWAHLSRAAVRAGDAQAAHDWLSRCNPRSDDLEADSEYRMATGLYYTAMRNFPPVLGALGAGPHDIPIHDSMDEACAVLRANAHERMGNIHAAVAVLQERMQNSPQSRLTLEKCMESLRYIQPCPQSFPIALGQHTAAAAGRAGSSVTGGGHIILLGMGILFAGIGALLIVGAIIAAIFGGWAAIPGLGLTGIIFLPIGLGLAAFGRVLKRQAEEAAWLRQHGLRGRGKIVGASPTGMSINDVPQMNVQLQVHVENMSPFMSQTKMMGQPPPMGSEVMVRVHPQDPTKVLIETD